MVRYRQLSMKSIFAAMGIGGHRLDPRLGKRIGVLDTPFCPCGTQCLCIKVL
jgi:hypothetical protein